MITDFESELAEIDKRVAERQAAYAQMYPGIDGSCLDLELQVNLLCARLLLAHLKRSSLDIPKFIPAETGCDRAE